MYDKNGTNGMLNYTYTFMHGEKQIALHLMKPAPRKKGSSSRITMVVLQVHNVYKSNSKKSRVRGRALFHPGGNDATELPHRGNKAHGPHVGPMKF